MDSRTEEQPEQQQQQQHRGEGWGFESGMEWHDLPSGVNIS